MAPYRTNARPVARRLSLWTALVLAALGGVTAASIYDARAALSFESAPRHG